MWMQVCMRQWVWIWMMLISVGVEWIVQRWFPKHGIQYIPLHCCQATLTSSYQVTILLVGSLTIDEHCLIILMPLTRTLNAHSSCRTHTQLPIREGEGMVGDEGCILDTTLHGTTIRVEERRRGLCGTMAAIAIRGACSNCRLRLSWRCGSMTSTATATATAILACFRCGPARA